MEVKHEASSPVHVITGQDPWESYLWWIKGFGWLQNLQIEFKNIIRRVTEGETSLDAETNRANDITGLINNLHIGGPLHGIVMGFAISGMRIS